MKNKKKKRKKAMKRKPKKPMYVLVNFKITESDRRAFMKSARRFTNGNLSAWLRYAASQFKPSRNQYGF